MLKPIIHDLEYESDNRTAELNGIDVSSHYLRLLEGATPTDIAEWARDEYSLVDPLRDVLIEDPSLIDDERKQRPWSIYSANLVEDLTASLGLSDDEDHDPVDLVRRWVEAARTAGFDEANSKRQATALDAELDIVIERFDLAGNPELLALALTRLMALPGGLDAVMPAINQVGASDPAAALRTAADVVQRAA